MEAKAILPPPKFVKKATEPPTLLPHFLTPMGMALLSKQQQPPPMYGARGATVPAKFLSQHGKGRQPRQEPPPQERQFCEGCEMEVQSKDDLRLHCLQHEQCPVMGCTYRGHPSVMDKHVTALHASGLFEHFKKLSTPEEIAAWREERRKKYPTYANAQLRLKAQEQRQKRGERLEENRSRFGKREDRNRAANTPSEARPREGPPSKRKARRLNKQQRKREFRDAHSSKSAINTALPTRQDTDQEEFTDNGILRFKGTAMLDDYQHKGSKREQVNNALASLGIYGSEDDSDEEQVPAINDRMEEDNESAPAQANASMGGPKTKISLKRVSEVHATQIIPATVLETHQNTQSSSDEAPQELPIAHSSNQPSVSEQAPNYTDSQLKTKPTRPTKAKATPRVRQRSGLDFRKRLRKQNTMLEKLLEPDIRHERNVLLQCVRFVCENNFFSESNQMSQVNTLE